MFKGDFLRKHCASGKRITLNKTKYRVGRMSYGDYFLEPGKKRGETEEFNKETLWLKKVENNPHLYKIE